jgi:hypothetical protein
MDLPLDLPPDILDDADPAQLADFEVLIDQRRRRSSCQDSRAGRSR